MKPKTISKDIRATLSARETAKKAASARLSILDAFDTNADMFPRIERAASARATSEEAAATLKRVPAPRRSLAASIVATAERIGLAVAQTGGDYSGDTRHAVVWGDRAAARTVTEKGDQYSRRCTYKKTDAEHVVTLDPAGVAPLVESEALRSLSARDGLHLIALYPDGSAVWVKTKGKAIVSENGWIIGNGQVCYHSTKSLDHARKGFERKHAAHLAELRERHLSDKQERRARLVARLCGNVTATLADAKAMGFCEPGIRAFQSRFGIGNEATLPALVRTGDPSAIRLAMKLARKLATT